MEVGGQRQAPQTGVLVKYLRFLLTFAGVLDLFAALYITFLKNSLSTHFYRMQRTVLL
jgi:hypothetical protein